MSIFNRLTNNNQMQQLQNDPVGMAKMAGYNVPPEMANDPKAMVMHLIQSGQLNNPALQKVMPMIQRMGLK